MSNSITISPSPINYEHIYHFWIDELELYATFLQPEAFEWVDFDNSNYLEYEGFIVTKHEVPRFVAKYAFAKEGIPAFAYYIWVEKSEKVWVATKNYVCFYGSTFRILWTIWVFDIMYKYFTPENAYPIRRIDICADILIDIWSVLKQLKNTEQVWAIFKGKRWEIETYNIGIKNKTNKRQFIRIYNKIADITAKKKFKLYSEYLKHEHITRVELEIRRELWRQLSIMDIYNESTLVWIFKNYIGLHTDAFTFLSPKEYSLGKKKTKVEFDVLQSKAYFEQRTKLLISYAKGLFSFWMCPVEILLWEWFIQEPTKYGLGYKNYMTYINALRKMERKSYKRNFALWKEKKEKEQWLKDIDNVFPNVNN
jgi:hypothetical protein